MGIGHTNEARGGNFLFTVGDNRELTFSVQTANVANVTMGTSPFYRGIKELKIPSNTVIMTPLNLDIIVTEDYNEWLYIYKWMMLCKNNNDSHLTQTKTCELTPLSAQSQSTVKFLYTDCFPIELGEMQYALNTDGSLVMTLSCILEYNVFKVIDQDGNVIDENYVG